LNITKNIFDQTTDEKISAQDFSEKITSKNELTCQQVNDVSNIKFENIVCGNICSNGLLLEDEYSKSLLEKIKLEDENKNKNICFIKDKEQEAVLEISNKFYENSFGLNEKELKTLNCLKPDFNQISSNQPKVYHNISSKEDEKTKKINQKGNKNKIKLESLFTSEINKSKIHLILVLIGDNNIYKLIIQKIISVRKNIDKMKYTSFPNSWNILKMMLKAVGTLEREEYSDIKKAIQIISVVN